MQLRQIKHVILYICYRFNILLCSYIFNGQYEGKLTVNYLLLLNFGLQETKITTNNTEFFPDFKNNNRA